MVEIKKPYLLFMGESDYAKTALGIFDWRPEYCVGQISFPPQSSYNGIQELTLAEARAKGARTLVIGVAPMGGKLPETWVTFLMDALKMGYDIASGLHSRIADVDELKSLANTKGQEIHDVRHTDQEFEIPLFKQRSGNRLLTVGTDCSVGKMYTALAIEKEMKQRGYNVDFRATGQTGILISGSGISVDAVVSDFISSATALISPPNDDRHWDIIEGQGSLFHPAYAGVTLGLLHGSQADALVLCTDPCRTHIRKFDSYLQPSLEKCIDAYTEMARLTNPAAKVIAIAMNTSKMTDCDAKYVLSQTENALELPCIDPVRTGVHSIVDLLPMI